jgi:hypothetical protein
MSYEKVVVETELTGKMVSTFNTIALWRFRWIFISCGVVLFACAVPFIIFWEGPQDLVPIILVVFLGLFFCVGIFFLPKMLVRAEQRVLVPNQITLTFFEDRLNVTMTGGVQGIGDAWFHAMRKFRLDARNEDWEWERIKSCFESKDHFCFRLAFNDIVIFQKDQIVKGNVMQLQELLAEKLGKRYKGRGRR